MIIFRQANNVFPKVRHRHLKFQNFFFKLFWKFLCDSCLCLHFKTILFQNPQHEVFEAAKLSSLKCRLHLCLKYYHFSREWNIKCSLMYYPHPSSSYSPFGLSFLFVDIILLSPEPSHFLDWVCPKNVCADLFPSFFAYVMAFGL